MMSDSTRYLKMQYLNHDNSECFTPADELMVIFTREEKYLPRKTQINNTSS